MKTLLRPSRRFSKAASTSRLPVPLRINCCIFKKAIRQLEAQGQVPRLIADANNEIQWAQEAVEANGSPEERRQFEELKRDVENAINGDVSKLEKTDLRNSSSCEFEF
jgi:hypothetical protein